MPLNRIAGSLFLLLMILSVLALSVGAVAPTEEAREEWEAQGILDEKIANWKAFKELGGCSAEEQGLFEGKLRSEKLAAGEQVADTVRVMVILVDFSDNPYTNGFAAEPSDFDSLLFSNRDIDPVFNDGGSMTDFYLENSYGIFYLVGDIYGWYRMPLAYSYYVGSDDGLTMGAVLARHAVDAAENAGADFSQYDRDFDGDIDGVIVIHAGAGAEEGANPAIWSHKGVVSGAPVSYDGVTISAYNLNPEESFGHIAPIGVFCHEYGHFLGLPDLYDVDYEPASSDGLGMWSLMASGNYLGQSRTPAHLDAFSKMRVGFVGVNILSENLYQAPVPEIISEPYIYRLNYSSTEYFLVENRQKKGFDINLPSSGICIYHVDETAPINNQNYLRYYVAMEQADGDNDLALSINNRGDGGDVWPGASGNRNFHDQSWPDSRTNFSAGTGIGIWRVTDSDSIMYADMDVFYSRPWPIFSGNDSLVFDDSPPYGDGDGIMEAGETINFHCTIQNLMRKGYNLRASLASNNGSVEFITPEVSFGTDLDITPRSNVDPIVFKLADTLTPIIDSLFLTISSDSLLAGGGSETYTKIFGLEISLGAPQIMIVDDDQGDEYQEALRSLVYGLRIPHTVYDAQAGTPSIGELAKHPMVFWHTGEVTGGALNAGDIAAMKSYLNDYNGKLYLSGFSCVPDINAIDPGFLSSYFHVNSTSSSNFYAFMGFDDNPLSAGTRYRYPPVVPVFGPLALLEPINGGQAAFSIESSPANIVGATFTGDYQTLLTTFPFEYISGAFTISGYDTPDTLMQRILDFFGGMATSVYDGSEFVALPSSFELDQNYPNPFNPTTTIAYTLRADKSDNGRPAPTLLAIYNALGQKVQTLVDKVQLPGEYTIEWDGKSSAGKKVSSGVYFYKLTRGDDSQARKMVLLK